MSAFEVEYNRGINPLTLSFRDAEAEADYRREESVRRLPFIRPALLLIIPVVCLFGILDSILIPELAKIAWAARAWLIILVLSVFGLTYTALVYNYLQVVLAMLMLVLGGCNIALVLAAPESIHYYVGLVLLMIYCYVSGLRFPYALSTSTLILVMYLALFFQYSADLGELMLASPLLLAGYVVATFAGHVSEKQRRELFSQARIIDHERRQQTLMALHDPLTGLPNRHLLDERMAQSLARARRQGTRFAVMFIDLDNFKTVNDEYGHVIGDQVLKVVADRLRDHVRQEDTAARFGGDEFVVLSEHVADEHGVEIAAGRLLSTIARPIEIKTSAGHHTEIQLTGSLGISLCPGDGNSLDELISHADEAMYRAKRGGDMGKMRFFGDEDSSLSKAQ